MSLLSRLAVSAARAYGALSSNPNAVSASYLSVAGGGGGGAFEGAGGGAGGFLTSTATLSILNTYSITVGSGGTSAGSSAGAGNNGSNSVISGTGLSTITSVGGGGGGGLGSQNGKNGGSGGGASSNSTTVGLATSGQGNNGGLGTGVPSSGTGGGGGGAGEAGNTDGASFGGDGLASSISGSSVTYAGGGAGYLAPTGGGTGGGGNPSVAGTANTGGGGGAWDGTGTAGQGGSGIVIISYTSATPKFVGGTLTTSGGNQIHTFTSSGTLSPLTPVTASYLVVAGGGGGAGHSGASRGGGGGGAGGYLESTATLYSGATYVVTVGAGGTGAGDDTATNGSNSVLSGTGLTTLTSIGGGAGRLAVNGVSGGSGGGGGYTTDTGGAGTSGQGNAGGDGGTATGTATDSGGGGGGAGGVGGNGSSASTGLGGTGGNGTASSITGTSVSRAGGGGGGNGNGNGGTATAGGGTGGGTGGAGTPNTGGGGGGKGLGTGGNGGSGTVIISYAGSQAFNGGLVTSSGGNTIHTFNATGALTPLTNNLTNSLRFRRSNSAYLSRTPTVAGNQTTWTWSAWVKRGQLGLDQLIFLANIAGVTDTTRLLVYFNSSDQLEIDGAANVFRITSAVFRDPSAWYHIVVIADTTNATANDRFRIYVNGNQQTMSTSFAFTQNANTAVNSTTLHAISNSSGSMFDGYMTDINLIDGQALEPYYFGNNDANGVWKPIKYTGMYGTNGFYLTFADTSAATAAAIGKDSSGNGNNWTPNNISVTAGTTYDAMLDVPTNTSATVANYAVWNPLSPTGATCADGNLQATITTSGKWTVGTFAVSSGKYYFECVLGGSTPELAIGIAPNSGTTVSSNALHYYSLDGKVYSSNSVVATGATFTSGDIIGVAFEPGGNAYFYKNNTLQATVSMPAGSDWCAEVYQTATRSNTATVNFGQRPFSYTPPSGFVALNTYNLPTPTILQGNKYMDATTYSAASPTNRVIVNQAQFKPDLVWIKSRSQAYSHYLFDSVRGTGAKALSSNLTSVEGADAGTSISSFNSNGYTISAGDAISDTSAVAWQWQAGQGSTSSNTSGSITSTTSVSTTAGFSIVTYTGTGANATVGHGLGVAPSWVIVKSRTTAENWMVYHISVGATKYIYLDGSGAAVTLSTIWNNTAPTSSVFSVGTNVTVNQSSTNYVAYCWAEIAGFSAFGSYTGNGSTDGVFVYLGFRPKFIITKVYSTSGYNWNMYDSSRGTYNENSNTLIANGTAVEETGFDPIDFLSNGFKLRMGNRGSNVSGASYIYMAFAENPFKNANAR